jgi:hypothetical protein
MVYCAIAELEARIMTNRMSIINKYFCTRLHSVVAKRAPVHVDPLPTFPRLWDAPDIEGIIKTS